MCPGLKMHLNQSESKQKQKNVMQWLDCWKKVKGSWKKPKLDQLEMQVLSQLPKKLNIMKLQPMEL